MKDHESWDIFALIFSSYFFNQMFIGRHNYGATFNYRVLLTFCLSVYCAYHLYLLFSFIDVFEIIHFVFINLILAISVLVYCCSSPV